MKPPIYIFIYQYYCKYLPNFTREIWCASLEEKG